MSNEDSVIIELKCRDCDNADCPIVTQSSELWHKYGGCSRRISEDISIEYFHYMNEIEPFIQQYENEKTKKNMRKKIMNFLFEKIYKAEFVHYYSHTGHVIIK